MSKITASSVKNSGAKSLFKTASQKVKKTLGGEKKGQLLTHQEDDAE